MSSAFEIRNPLPLGQSDFRALRDENSLAAPYGIAVHATAEIGEKLTDHTIVPGEKVKESINRLITNDNLVVMDDEAGDLVIVEPGDAGECVDALELTWIFHEAR